MERTDVERRIGATSVVPVFRLPDADAAVRVAHRRACPLTDPLGTLVNVQATVVMFVSIPLAWLAQRLSD